MYIEDREKREKQMKKVKKQTENCLPVTASLLETKTEETSGGVGQNLRKESKW